MGCTSSSSASDVPSADNRLKMPKNMDFNITEQTVKMNSKTNTDFFDLGSDYQSEVFVDFTSEFIPLPGFVVKTKNSTGGAKVFINILKTNEIPWPKLNTKAFTFPSRLTFDKSNADTSLYDHVIPADVVVECEQDATQEKRKAVVLNAIKQISEFYMQTLDSDYKLPLIKKGHMDEVESMTVSCFFDSRKSNRIDNEDKTKAEFRTKCYISMSYLNTKHDIIFSPFVKPKPKPIVAVATFDEKHSRRKTNAMLVIKSDIASPIDANNDGIDDHLQLKDRDLDGINDEDEDMTSTYFCNLYKGEALASTEKNYLDMRVSGMTGSSFTEVYAVLDCGYLRLFEHQSSQIPYGKTMKEGICLFGYSVYNYDAQAKAKEAKAKSDGKKVDQTRENQTQHDCFVSLVPHAYDVLADKQGPTSFSSICDLMTHVGETPLSDPIETPKEIVAGQELLEYTSVRSIYICVSEVGNVIRSGHWIEDPEIRRLQKGDVVRTVGFGFIVVHGLKVKRLKTVLSSGQVGWCSESRADPNKPQNVMEAFQPSTPFDNMLDSKGTGKMYIFKCHDPTAATNWVDHIDSQIKYAHFTRARSEIFKDPEDVFRKLSFVTLTQKFNIFLSLNEIVVKAGKIKKPNPLGVEYDRILLLTDKQRLIYIDPSTFELKGLIYISSAFFKTTTMLKSSKQDKKANALKFENTINPKKVKVSEFRIHDEWFNATSDHPLMYTAYKTARNDPAKAINQPNTDPETRQRRGSAYVSDDEEEEFKGNEIFVDDPAAHFVYKKVASPLEDWKQAINQCKMMETGLTRSEKIIDVTLDD